MAIMQPPTGPIEISDPKNVPELFINGPFNIVNMGGMVQITFTTVRPDANDLFARKSDPKFQGTVICRTPYARRTGSAIGPKSRRQSYQGC